jgi:hypothetical protein
MVNEHPRRTARGLIYADRDSGCGSARRHLEGYGLRAPEVNGVPGISAAGNNYFLLAPNGSN